MPEWELLFAFLDDIYIVSSPAKREESVICSRPICTGWQEYNCMRQGFGTKLECALQRWQNWATKCGARGVKILETPLWSPECPRSRQEQVRRGALVGSHQFECRICNARGKFWCNALGPGVTISSARCHHPVSHVRVLKATIQE